MPRPVRKTPISKSLHKMAAANAAAAAQKQDPSTDPKTAAKTHRRSRSGCFTCRLRRKKCEEGRPSCKACTHLGLQCNYKRPMWWSNADLRRQQKDMIKDLIKQTQLTKKSQAPQSSTGSTTPPGLCHSVQSAPNTEDIHYDSLPHTRQGSVDSPFPQVDDFNQFPANGLFDMPTHTQQLMSQNTAYSPFEIDIKTERSVYVNDVQMRKDSTISTFSTFQQPQSFGMPTLPSNDSWIQQEYHESLDETFTEEPVDFNFFDFQHGQLSPNHESLIEVDDCDKYLLNHFLDKVIKQVFPVLDANQHGSVRTDMIVPALESNKAYLHCCLSVAAADMKHTQGDTGTEIDNDTLRHRFAAVHELCDALAVPEQTDHSKVLEATLAMIFFQCAVGGGKDSVPDIPWDQHFQAAGDLINTMQLPSTIILGIDEASRDGKPAPRPPFNMTLTSWIDILGATMLGREPVYSDTYRQLRDREASAGLAELMGCDDQVMFMISEIACLEYQQRTLGLAQDPVCSFVQGIASFLNNVEPSDPMIQNCFSPTGAIRPKQLQTNLTAIFSIAARMYLLSLVPGHDMTSPSMRHLLSRFAWAMQYIPEGPDGFDKCLAWPFLIAGSNATVESSFRTLFAERLAKLGESANSGSLGRVRELLYDVWAINDANIAHGDMRGVHWRDVMQTKEWDFLLI